MLEGPDLARRSVHLEACALKTHGCDPEVDCLQSETDIIGLEREQLCVVSVAFDITVKGSSPYDGGVDHGDQARCEERLLSYKGPWRVGHTKKYRMLVRDTQCLVLDSGEER